MAAADPRYTVGIDLGTTHSALAYVDLRASEPAVALLEVPQLVAPGALEPRPLLPSFLYLASASEFAEAALDLPWARGRRYAVGELGRNHGWQVPMRLVASAKSWLSHAGVDRQAAILPPEPPGAPPVDVERVSPVEASARYLAHLRDAWNHRMASGDETACLERQDVHLTVPASFDAVARELTVRAARQAGLEVTLLEEPQAAFYAWLGARGDAWRELLKVGDNVLVCDIGGGTTDFSLISVTDHGGNLELERVAVGEHILLGGDNMDLAVANALGSRLAAGGTRLDAWQARSLVFASRAGKEALLGGDGRDEHPVAVLGRGRSLVGGTIQAELRRADVEALILEGFFPVCASNDRPQQRRRAGLQELGLPFAADPAVTRHLAAFLGDHDARPTTVLFNGGVMKSPLLRRRVVESLAAWQTDETLRLLEGTDYDRAVALGAAYYGLVRRGRGIRIRGGTARSYYVGVETSMPAVPGMAPPLKAICVAPRGMEEGTESALAPEEFGLVVGEPAELRLLSSTVRGSDPVGAVVDDLEGIEEVAPLEIHLEPSAHFAAGQPVPVRLRTRVTEVGTLEIWCVAARDAGDQWKLEFDVRGTER